MSILNIDTESLNSTVSMANQVNDQISEASDLLDKIAEHYDWICPERNRLIDMTRSNKRKAGQIRDCSNDFHKAVQRAAAEFEDAMRENCKKLDTLDELTGKLIDMVPKLAQSVYGGSGGGSAINIVDIQALGNAMEG